MAVAGWVERNETHHLPVNLLFGVSHLAKFSFTHPGSSAPILRIYPGSNITVKGGIRPIGIALDMPVLHRVVMDVIYMVFPVFLIPQCMFLIPALVVAFLMGYALLHPSYVKA